METVVVVWWLVFAGNGNAGSSVLPVPYGTKQICTDTADAINERNSYPYVGAFCVAQPTTDVRRWLNGHSWRGYSNY